MLTLQAGVEGNHRSIGLPFMSDKRLIAGSNPGEETFFQVIFTRMREFNMFGGECPEE